MTDWTPEELRKDLENRVQCDLFYDVPKGFVDMLVKDREDAKKYKLMIGDLDTGGTSEAEATRLYNNEQIVKRLEEEKKLFEKDMKTLEVKEKEIVDELGKDDHLLTFAVRFYVLRCNQTLKRIMVGKDDSS